jgi:hypothetical protein
LRRVGAMFKEGIAVKSCPIIEGFVREQVEEICGKTLQNRFEAA